MRGEIIEERIDPYLKTGWDFGYVIKTPTERILLRKQKKFDTSTQFMLK
ncbi:hypothetical protein C8D75_0302 [Petrotoga olearia]|uniref:Uncharacterized protein n=2 Tax=Petrotoga olearia TaxID=156203 RepID=A0A2K1P173_9BACT|nr:hypothetical protein X929_04145 [Petrotoga olearia DSM 13574]RMA76649.1 hypothetical protein C8D75_0302 [Petrotoga olearia]